jgi:hypothetical protein
MNGTTDSDDGGEINLGEEQGESPSMEASEQQPSYPTVMLSGNHNLNRIADTGHHTIKGKVIARHMPSKHNKKHRVEMEIHSIKPQFKAGRPKKSTMADDGENMKKLLQNVPE